MFTFPRRPVMARAGIGAVLVALVAIAGYNIGLAESPNAGVSAAQSETGGRSAVVAPRLKGTEPATTSYASIVDAVAPARLRRVDPGDRRGPAVEQPEQGRVDPADLPPRPREAPQAPSFPHAASHDVLFFAYRAAR